MEKRVKLLNRTIILATAIIATTAIAQENTIAKINSTNTVVLNNIFDTTQLENIQVLELSNQEMTETKGAVLPFVAGALMGGALGAWSNHAISYYQTGDFASTQSTLFATGAGAIGGGYTNLMLRGAGISTSAFAPSAWQGTNGIANTLIRTNGAGLGLSYSGVYKNQPVTPNTSISNIKITPYQPNNPIIYRR